MNKIIFFDLENTLIPDWYEDRSTLLFLEHPVLQEWIISQGSFRAGLFSFAIWRDEDIKLFNQTLRPILEEKLSIKFEDNLIIASNEIKEWINLWNKTPFNTAMENSLIHKK